ncbi:Beta-glucanase, GH16 family [Streptomyces sp. TLI_053]|uniref:glycoside hydrolase family 16 protein n=1 Tax=Streptomyces sp. TLI_053 TaxID=1855352 RepID=UPI000879A72D|nr:glycoside hydrolase family 16 protein [Streptomyces sp. TLI_053]SDT29027.1 Beta-glucanase, GH16 family [Streptomyces sp. TLI_053]
MTGSWSPTVRRAAPALLGWAAVAATALPAGSPPRVALTAAFVLAGPGAAALSGRPTIARAAGPDRWAAAVLVLALSLALASLTTVGLMLGGVFSARTALVVLAAVSTLLVVLPPRSRSSRSSSSSRSLTSRPRSSRPRSSRPRTSRPRTSRLRTSRPRGSRSGRAVGTTAAVALLVLVAACSGSGGGRSTTSGASGASRAGGGGSGPAAAGAALPEGAPPLPASAAPWHLAFDDRFTGTGLDRSKWTTCYDWNDHGCTNAGNGEDQWYQPGQVRAGGGLLTLTAQRRTAAGTDGRSHPWVSGMVSTGRDSWNAPPRHTFTYGYFSAAIKVPKDPHGFFPAFWLIPAESRGTPPELDIAEFPNTDQYAQMYLHWRAEDGSDQHVGQSAGPADFSAGFHVFAVDWQPDAVTWYVDGTPWFKVSDPARIPDVAMELVVNLAVGYLESPPAGTDSAALQVEWVQVWQH